LSGEERVQKGLEEGLHGPNTVGGRLLAEVGIQTNHGAEEGHSAKDERDLLRAGPVFNRARSLRVRGPEKRRLGEGESEPKIRRESIEPLKEDGRLLHGPHNSDIINVGRDSKSAEAVQGLLKNRLQTEAEQQCTKNTSLSWSAPRDETLNQPIAIKEIEWGGNAVAQVRDAPQWWELREGIETIQHDVSKHAVEAVDKVQAQKNVIRVELKQSLDSVNNGFNSSSCTNAKLEGGEQTGESAGGEQAEGKRRGSAKEDLGNSNWPNAAVLLLGRDEPAGKKPGSGGRIDPPTGNILKESSDGEKKKRVFC
jgi:hypothetical protein